MSQGMMIYQNNKSNGYVTGYLPLGIGNLPDAVLHKLYNHKDLGFHSEMIGDTVVNLVEKGALTNAKKSIQTGKIVSSFGMGTKKLYNFLDDNSFVCKYFILFSCLGKKTLYQESHQNIIYVLLEELLCRRFLIYWQKSMVLNNS